MAARRSPRQSLGFLLKDVTRLMRRNLMRRIGHLGLTQAQWQALAHLARNEGINQVTLADLMETQPITLARNIDRLEAAGFVERRPDPEDRRAVRLFLTDAAEPVIETLWQLAGETHAEAQAGLSTADREHLVETLKQMRSNLIACETEAKITDQPTPSASARRKKEQSK